MLPENFHPMLATLSEPFSSPDFSFEIKWDGYRCLSFLDGKTRLLSRNQKELTDFFPDLQNLHQKLKLPNCLIDGEIIALRNGKPSFLELQKRAQLKNINKIKQMSSTIPVVYVAFDLLYLNNNPIFKKPLIERKELLIKNCISEDELVISNYIHKDGVNYYNSIVEMGLEGVVAKKNDSPYIPGKRVKTWLKFKRRLKQNFIICGYNLQPTKRGQLSSLLLGAYYDYKLQLFGMVGTGFSHSDLELILKELEKIKTDICPFTQTAITQKNTVWVKPVIVGEVEYLELTDDNSLRHPVFKRFRPDLNPKDCKFEG